MTVTVSATRFMVERLGIKAEIILREAIRVPLCSSCHGLFTAQIPTPSSVQSEFASWHPLRFGQVIFAFPLSSFQSG
jgi:hypothetical protein